MIILSFLRDRYEDMLAFYQRGTRGWADRDTWNMDHYLAEVLPAMLRHLAKTSHSYPPYLEVEGDTTGLDRWKVILEEIALGFDEYNVVKNSDAQYRTAAYTPALECMKKLFDHYLHLWS